MYLNKLIILVLLVIIVFISFNYYLNHLNQGVTFSYKENLLPLIESKNNKVELYEEVIYYPINNLNIYSKSPVNTKYIQDNNQYIVYVSNEYGTINTFFEYIYKPKEIIEVVKEVYINKNTKDNDINDNTKILNEINNDSISGIKDIELPLDSDIHILNQLLTKDIKTSSQITIDYAEVNLSKIGKYKVYYYTENKKYHCYVTIY